MERIHFDHGSLNSDTPHHPLQQSGFGLIELMLSATIFLSVSAAVFNTMAETQRLAAYQSEVQSVLDNTRIALETAVNLLQQAGNDPFLTGLSGITIISDSQVQIQSDLTGSEGPGLPDKGDPDGDISDSGENIVIKYNAAAQTLNIAQGGGAAQAVANGISAFSLGYYDTNGLPTDQGSNVHLVTVSVSGAGRSPDPQTGRIFALRLASNVRILTRP